MKKLILISAFISTFSLAHDSPPVAVGGTRVDTSVSGGSAMDMLGMKSAPFEEGGGSGANSNIKIYSTCTSTNGETYQKGDAEYEQCLDEQARKARAASQNSAGGAPAVKGKANPGGAGVGVKFGK